MRWKGRRASGNVEDRRGVPVKGIVGGGLGAVVMVIAALVLGVDPSAFLGGGGGGGPVAGPSGEVGVPDDPEGRFIATMLADTEDTWNRIFAASGQDYPEPTLVLFNDAVRSACGTADAAVGPFYCPRDAQLYLDLGFFEQLKSRLGASGEAAEAYVVAHEVGHHVQNLLGTTGSFGGYTESGPNSQAVRIELQADCFAGIWAHHTASQGYLDPGDIEDAMSAAAAVGDDAIQRRTQGYVVPESFTHGTAEQRARWFRTGYQTGEPNSCDTFRSGI